MDSDLYVELGITSPNHTQISLPRSSSRGQFAKSILAIAIFGIVLFIPYSILVHIYSLNMETKQLPMDAIVFCVVWTLFICSFFRATFTSPGLVENGWYKRYPSMHETLKRKWCIYKEEMKPHNHDNDNDDETTNLLMEDDDEYTFPDNFSRPPRSHFCRELQSNILRMDHFCIWFNNAVGLFNYKYFLLSIVYVSIGCLLSLYILFYRSFIVPIRSEYGLFGALCLLITAVVCIYFSVFGTMHSCMHLWQTSKNLTSIEYRKLMKIKAMAYHFNVEFVHTHEFDNGMFSNYKKMIGNDIWFWLLPIKPSLPEDGYEFQINIQNKAKIENVAKLIQLKREELWKRPRINRNVTES